MNSWFKQALLAWNSIENPRKMPWKGEKDPYRIWISEVILQQTRVEQGTDYYNRFIREFPTVDELAAASEKHVFKLWEGLGYYSRCRNLIIAAKTIAEKYKGRFPDNYEEIRALKGIGPYTAAAIGSFAFNLPYAVVDGNVFRVLTRIFGIEDPVDKTYGKQYLNQLATELLDKKLPGIYNQAIMDFGATICKPRKPLCGTCPFKKKCKALLLGKPEAFPVKSKKTARKKRWFYYLLIESKKGVLIRERTGKDIWKHLYEFILFERDEETDTRIIKEMAQDFAVQAGMNFISVSVSEVYKQQLSHQDISGRFIHMKVKDQIGVPVGFEWVAAKDLKKFPFPKYILSYLMEKG